jgi:hypothetical protein
MKWYAITGRVFGDDEDSCRVYRSRSEKAACAAFVKDMRQEADLPLLDAGEFNCVFINSVCVSDTEITLL